MLIDLFTKFNFWNTLNSYFTVSFTSGENILSLCQGEAQSPWKKEKKRRKKENCRAKNATHVAILERTLQKSDDQRSAETCKQLLAAERKNIESILFKNSFSEQIKPKKKKKLIKEQLTYLPLQ